MHIKQYLSLIFFMAAFSGYNTVFAESTETDNTTTNHKQHNLWPGIYRAFLPCDDCKGVKTSLALNKNNSYMLISQYVGKSDREIIEKGKFAWGDDGNTLILTPRNSTQARYFLIGEETLTVLDSKGNRITGDSANRYIMRKTEMAPPQSSQHH